LPFSQKYTFLLNNHLIKFNKDFIICLVKESFVLDDFEAAEGYGNRRQCALFKFSVKDAEGEIGEGGRMSSGVNRHP
jgi:hypothetical protein